MRFLTAAPLVALLAGCSGPAVVEEGTVVRFSVIAAPELSAESEESLYEVVTQLSTEPRLNFALVPGPLLAAEDEDLRFGLIGALGQLAGELIVALGPDDGPQAELLEAFDEQLPNHGGDLAYRGKRVGPLRPVALDPNGGFPDKKTRSARRDDDADAQEDADDADDADDAGHGGRILVQGGAQGVKRGLLVVRVGPDVRLEQTENGAVLQLPSVAKPPHVYAVAELRDGTLSVDVRSLRGGNLPKPAPVRLITEAPQ